MRKKASETIGIIMELLAHATRNPTASWDELLKMTGDIKPGSHMTPEEIAAAKKHHEGLGDLAGAAGKYVDEETGDLNKSDPDYLRAALEREQSGIGPVGGSILGGGVAAGGLLGGQAIAKQIKSKGLPDWMRTMRGAQPGGMMKLQNDRGNEKRANPIMDLIHQMIGSDPGASMPQPGAPSLAGEQPFHQDPAALKEMQGKGQHDVELWKHYLDQAFEPDFGDHERLRNLQEHVSRLGAEGKADELLAALQQMQEEQPDMLAQAQSAGRSQGVGEGAAAGGALGGGAGLLAGGAAGAGGMAAARKMRKKGSNMSLIDLLRDEAFEARPRRKVAHHGIDLDSVLEKIADDDGDDNGEAPQGDKGDDKGGDDENEAVPGLGEHEPESNEGVQLPPELQHLLMMLMQHPEILQQLMHGGGIPDEAMGGGEQGGGMPPEMAAMAGGGGAAGGPPGM